MKRNTSLQFRIALIALSFVLWVGTASAQNSLDAQRGTGPVRTESKMLYHDGPVLANIQNVYFIFYGCWTDACRSGNTTAVQILNDYGATIGNSDYMGINNTYTDKFGHSATKTIFFGGEVFDGSYSHGFDLTKSDIEAIIADQILNRLLPQDSQGIYVVFAADNIAALQLVSALKGLHLSIVPISSRADNYPTSSSAIHLVVLRSQAHSLETNQLQMTTLQAMRW